MKPNKDILFCQMIQSQLYAQYWMTLVSSGLAAKRNVQVGCEPSEEHPLGRRDQTDAEKNQAAMATALSHIQNLHNVMETYGAIERGDCE